MFQGSERQALFISLGRSSRKLAAQDREFSLGFGGDGKRLNTAFTRAISLVVVVGDPFSMTADPQLNNFLVWARRNGAILRDFGGLDLMSQEYLDSRTEEDAAVTVPQAKVFETQSDAQTLDVVQTATKKLPTPRSKPQVEPSEPPGLGKGGPRSKPQVEPFSEPPGLAKGGASQTSSEVEIPPASAPVIPPALSNPLHQGLPQWTPTPPLLHDEPQYRPPRGTDTLTVPFTAGPNESLVLPPSDWQWQTIYTASSFSLQWLVDSGVPSWVLEGNELIFSLVGLTYSFKRTKASISLHFKVNSGVAMPPLHSPDGRSRNKADLLVLHKVHFPRRFV